MARQPWEGRCVQFNGLHDDRVIFSLRITKADIEEFATFDSSLVWKLFPDATHVLSMHGLQDKTVPP